MYLIKELSFLLKVSNVKINRSLLIKELLSDPSYPCLVSISKTLNFFGVENESYIVDIDHLSSLKNVIVHTTDENGHFYVLKGCCKDDVYLYDGSDKTISKSEFLSIWNGVTLKINRVHQDYHPSNNHTLSIFFATLFLLVVSSVSILQDKMIQALFFLNIIGMALAGTLLKKQMYNYDTIPFCMRGTKFDCKYVSDRNPFRRWIPFDLPVLGLLLTLNFLNMKKLELSQMMCILGGQVSDCKAVQALACALSEKHASPKEWDEWCGLYDKYC